jgi:hypothetical protein
MGIANTAYWKFTRLNILLKRNKIGKGMTGTVSQSSLF